MPQALISNNGLQFDSKVFCKCCSNLGIVNRYSSLTYPQSNGQAKAMNKSIVNLKKRLEGAKENWAEDLLNFLWAYRTTPRRSMGETPFVMTYGAEAIILIEISLMSMRVDNYNQSDNEARMAGV